MKKRSKAPILMRKPPLKGKIPKKANARFSHPFDPDADMVRRKAGQGRLCYKAHFAVDGGDARIITAVSATGGAIADEHLLLGLLVEHEALVGRPSDLVADQKYGTKTNFRILKVKGIRPAIKPSSGKSPIGGYHKDRFAYDKQKDAYICPAGNVLKRSPDVSSTKAAYRSMKADCSMCPLKEACIPGKKRKTIIRTPSDAIFSWAREFLKTPRGKELQRRRSIWSETIFAQAKNSHGMGKARFRRRWKVEIQVLMTASAMNLKKLARMGSKREEHPLARRLCSTLRPFLVSSLPGRVRFGNGSHSLFSHRLEHRLEYSDMRIRRGKLSILSM